MDVIGKLLRPRSVAVIGASADPLKISGRPVTFLLKHGFSGEIYPVNPRMNRIGELKCYPDIASLPVVPDVGIVLLGAERAQDAVRELSARGAAAAIVLASGYAEVGAEGARRQQQLIESAGSMRLLGPNTIGVVNLTDSIVLSASGGLEMKDFPAGSIAVVAQSGGILGALLSRAEPFRSTRIFLLAAAIFLTLIIGLSRIYLGVHYPTDVLGGWCAGATWALGCWVLARRYISARSC